MKKYISGTSARRQRIRANHERLHAEYENFLRDFGALLTYEQWLNHRKTFAAAADGVYL